MIRGRRLFARRIVWAAAAVVMAVVAGSVVVIGSASAAPQVNLKTWYVLVNRNSGKVLDDRAFATNDGAAVVQWDRNGGANQQWQFIDSGDGYYRLQNRNSGEVLDVVVELLPPATADDADDEPAPLGAWVVESLPLGAWLAETPPVVAVGALLALALLALPMLPAATSCHC